MSVRAPTTLFFDVAGQRDYWPGGSWPLVTAEEGEHVARLFGLAARLGIRQGGIVCVHDAPPCGAAGGPGEGPPRDSPPSSLAIAAATPPHCVSDTPGAARAPGCDPALAPRYWLPAAAVHGTEALDRHYADYLGSGCATAPDQSPALARVLGHLTAGILDVVVFGAGIELGVDRAIDALLRRRIRIHAVLDAAGAQSAERAQHTIAFWKRRTVDVTTTAMIERLLLRES